MKLVLSFFLIAGLLGAQAHGGGHAAGGVVFTSPGGYGNVAFPGTGRPSVPPSFSGGLQGRGGVGNGRGLNRGYGGGSYGYPVIVGGGGFYDQGYYGQSQQQQPNITIINNPPAPALAPTVVINQNFAAPAEQFGPGESETTHIFQSTPTPPRVAESVSDRAAPPKFFLIAFKDHSVYSALAYWVEDKTMHYVTPQQTHNQASLDLIDVDFTKKLNNR